VFFSKEAEMDSISSLCHEVSGNFVVEVVGVGAVAFLNIKRYSLQLAVLKVYRKCSRKPPTSLTPRFIHLNKGTGMPRYILQLT
jgi:hypothetical protein